METGLTFNLYKKALINNESEYYDPEQVELAGRGLIQTTAKNCNKNIKGGWTISKSDMLRTKEVNLEEHALVVDISPKSQTINLYEIISVAGFSYGTWTPIMIIYEQLFADFEIELKNTSTSVFKIRFLDGLCNRTKIRTILYLNGGFETGTWNFGGNSRTTGALLREDAWNYFQKVSI